MRSASPAIGSLAAQHIFSSRRAALGSERSSPGRSRCTRFATGAIFRLKEGSMSATTRIVTNPDVMLGKPVVEEPVLPPSLFSRNSLAASLSTRYWVPTRR